MIWAILVFLGVPLWLCAIAIGTLVLRARRLRARHGNIAVRVLRPGHTRWTRGNGLWVSDVFAWRGTPAAWAEDLVHVTDAHQRVVTPDEGKALRRLSTTPVLVDLTGSEGEALTVAAADTDLAALLGPFTPRPDTFRA